MAAKAQKKLAPKATSERPAKAPPPAYFLSLTVENVRCFGPKQTLDLSDGKGRPARWTVILGDNGTGKTTLLQSLVAVEPSRMLGSLEAMIVPSAFRAAFAVYEPLVSSSGDFQRGTGDSTTRISVSISAGQSFAKRSTRTSTHEVGVQWIGAKKRSSAYSSDSDKVAGLVCYGYGAARKMDLSSLSGRYTEDSSANLFREDAELINPEAWLLQTDYTASKKSPAQAAATARREQVGQILSAILPDVDDIRFLVPIVVKDKPRVEFKTPYGWVPIWSLGLGYRTMIAWIVDLASRLFDRYPDSPDPIAEPAVVLVDEIDLHLHPRWQRKIMSFLSERFKNTQFIVTAHSPLIVQAATDANIAVLRREGDHVVIDQSIKAVRGWRIDQVLTSDLFGLETARPPEFDELLRERKKILTKGRLTRRDKEKLQLLNAQMGELPAGENLQQFEAMDIIQRAAKRIKKADN